MGLWCRRASGKLDSIPNQPRKTQTAFSRPNGTVPTRHSGTHAKRRHDFCTRSYTNHEEGHKTPKLSGRDFYPSLRAKNPPKQYIGFLCRQRAPRINVDATTEAHLFRGKGPSLQLSRHPLVNWDHGRACVREQHSSTSSPWQH